MFRRSLCMLSGFILAMWQTNLHAGQPVVPGRLIAVDGVQLHLLCRGRGAPSVILDSGLGGVALEWEAVQQALAGELTVCSYDRAGMGWSDAPKAPRTTGRIVTELRNLLQQGKVAPPYVLVGHSFGGYTAQLFASRYRRDVAGLVLLDSSHPEQVERFLAPPIGLRTVPRRRGVMIMSAPPMPRALPDHLKIPVARLLAQYKSMRTTHDELMHFADSAHQVRDADVRLEVPIVVVSRGRHEWSRGAKGALKERLWRTLQEELSLLSPRSAHLLALQSGHHIHLEQPQLVADAVRMVVAESYGVAAPIRVRAAAHAMSLNRVAWLRNSLETAPRAFAANTGLMKVAKTF